MSYRKVVNCVLDEDSSLWASVFLDGCVHQCNICKNGDAKEFSNRIMNLGHVHHIMSMVERDLCTGLKFEGGEPLSGDNIECVKFIISQLRFNKIVKPVKLHTCYSANEIDPKIIEFLNENSVSVRFEDISCLQKLEASMEVILSNN